MEGKEDELDRKDLALVDKIFDSLDIDNEGRVDIEKVSFQFSSNYQNTQLLLLSSVLFCHIKSGSFFILLCFSY